MVISPRHNTRSRRPCRPSRGGALLAVLWLVAALSVIALAIAATVRSEVERSTTNAEAVRAYYLAKGAIDRAALYIQWGAAANQPGRPQSTTCAACGPSSFACLRA